MKLFIVPLAAAAIALTAAPAVAKSKKHRMHHHHHHGQSYYGGGYGGWYGGGWRTRAVSDPSYVSPGYLRARSLGRCVVDLGYGRYEYCNW